MSDNLGEKVSFPDSLPYPGKQPPDDLFASAEDTDSAFDMAEVQPVKVAPKVEPKVKTPVKSSTKKPSLQLQKFREAFSIQRIKKTPYKVVRTDSEGNEVSMTFQLRAMNYEDFQWVAVKATELSHLPLAFAWNLTSTAISICAMDFELDEGAEHTPIHEVFGIDVDSKLRDPYYPPADVRFAAAESLLGELQASLYDVVEELHRAIDTHITSQSQSFEKEKAESPLV
jgi:hypothetical protein